MTRNEAKAKADSIARYLSHERPEQIIVDDYGDMIALVFTLIPDDTHPWLKAIEIQSDSASPKVVETLLTAWKMQVLGQIAQDECSPVVRAAIAKFGYERVLSALKPKSVH